MKWSNRINAKLVYVFMFPSTGEVSNGPRIAMAIRLAQRHGYATIIPTGPYYGTRKPKNQFMFFIRTVTDMLLHSEGVIEEGVLLTQWIMRTKPKALVCHSGFSHGACTSALTSAACILMGLDGSRMACAPYTGFASPNVLADGLLEHVLDWGALSDEFLDSYEECRHELYKLLNESQLDLVVSKVQNPNNRLAVVRGISFERDGVIQPKYTQDMRRQFAPIVASGKVEMEWMPGGHPFSLLVRPYFQQRLIASVVEELVQKQPIE